MSKIPVHEELLTDGIDGHLLGYKCKSCNHVLPPLTKRMSNSQAFLQFLTKWTIVTSRINRKDSADILPTNCLALVDTKRYQ